MTQDKMTGLQGHKPNRDIGQRIAEKRRKQRSQSVAIKHARQKNGGNKMQTVKRSECCKNANPNAARNALGRIGQAPNPMFHVLKRPRPATFGPKQVAHDVYHRSPVTSFKYHRAPLILLSFRLRRDAQCVNDELRPLHLLPAKPC